MLEAGLCQPNIACPPQVAAAHTLRDRAFDPGTFGILRFEFGSLLTSTRRLNRLMLFLRTNRDTACPHLGLRTLRATRADATVFGVEGNMDARVPFPINAGRPLPTDLALRAGG